MVCGVGRTTVAASTPTGVKIWTAKTIDMIVFTLTKKKGNGRMEIAPLKKISFAK